REAGARAERRGRYSRPPGRRGTGRAVPLRRCLRARGGRHAPSHSTTPRDHQGVVARVAPYRYADAYELAAADQPLLVCLDQVTDPHNLGAVARSAEGAGATGVIVSRDVAARVTPAVSRASAGAVEHLPIAVVQNLARFLNEIKGPELWVWGA